MAVAAVSDRRLLVMNSSAVGDRRYSRKIVDANMTASLRRWLQASAHTNRLAMAEVAIPRELFRAILERIGHPRLPTPLTG